MSTKTPSSFIKEGDLLEMVIGNGPGTKNRVRSKIEVMLEKLQLNSENQLVERGEFIVLETDQKIFQKGQRIDIHYDAKYETPHVYRLSCKSQAYGSFWLLKQAKPKRVENVQKEEIQKIKKQYGSGWFSSCCVM